MKRNLVLNSSGMRPFLEAWRWITIPWNKYSEYDNDLDETCHCGATYHVYFIVQDSRIAYIRGVETTLYRPHRQKRLCGECLYVLSHSFGPWKNGYFICTDKSVRVKWNACLASTAPTIITPIIPLSTFSDLSSSPFLTYSLWRKKTGRELYDDLRG